MNSQIEQLKSTTFGGRKFNRYQLEDIQKITTIFSKLSRRELAHTICEQYSWHTPRGTHSIQTCLNALEEMEACGILRLPPKREQIKRRSEKEIAWTDEANPQSEINCSVKELMPITIQLVKDSAQTQLWNEFIDRYHYLGYKRPFGSYLRYFVVDKYGRKLGCLLFSFASNKLACRDEWLGWTDKQRQKNLSLVINNNRFLIFPWVDVTHLASKF